MNIDRQQSSENEQEEETIDIPAITKDELERAFSIFDSFAHQEDSFEKEQHPTRGKKCAIRLIWSIKTFWIDPTATRPTTTFFARSDVAVTRYDGDASLDIWNTLNQIEYVDLNATAILIGS